MVKSSSSEAIYFRLVAFINNLLSNFIPNLINKILNLEITLSISPFKKLTSPNKYKDDRVLRKIFRFSY